MSRIATMASRACFSGVALCAGGVLAGSALNPFFLDVPLLVGLPLLSAVLVLSWIGRDRPSRVLGVASVALLAVAMARVPRGPASPRTFVLGVDGATFAVIDAHPDILPNFTALRNDGARAVLRSRDPMFSPLLWTTIASGRTPDEHGVHGFHVHADDCKVARFWDVAEEQGQGVGLYKWLVDYPPRSFKTGGFWVPSWLAPDVQTFPADLSVVKELELSRRLRRKQVAAKHSTVSMAVRLVGVGVRLSTLLRAVSWSLEERILSPKTERVNTAMQELRGWIDRDVFVASVHRTRPDLASFTYYATDGLAHLYWDKYEAGQHSGGQGAVDSPVLAAYRQADAILLSIRGMMGPDARLIVVSDHGFQAMDGTGLAGQFAPLTERLRARLDVQVPSGAPFDVMKVGHKLTVGFADPAQREPVRAALAALVDAKGEAFYRVEDIDGMGGALGLTLADEQLTGERLATDTVGGESITAYVTLTDAYTGTHKWDGIFYAYGEGVQPGTELAEVPLLDAAPTILAAAGLPAARNMVGTAQIFAELPRVDSWDSLVLDLQWVDVGEAGVGVNTDALKLLGYVQ
ncbi:MAG: hypothetical protein EXR69_01040 [Myxococcales bacterium]|nr:hypothetical protein [Myxococcales bacterium]